MIWRLILTFVVAPIAGWSFYHYHYMGKDTADGKRPATVVEPLMLPAFVVMVVVISLVWGRMWRSGGLATALGFTFLGLFLQISLYFLVLLCLMPLLRRHISAQACATLWILPNLMYVMTYARFAGMKPLFLLPIPGPKGQKMLALIWLAGFGGTLLWQLGSHFRFRRSLLKGARPVERVEIRNLYARARGRCEQKYTIPLLVSHEVQTPVTVGCFRSTAVMVLPKEDYTEEELTLIFRHEFQHIQQADMRTKVFLAFCAAMCWFNPLMWIARKKASEDLELSCDEEVLKGADETVRRRYAELLLRTAGDSRGFSTCLSAGANSLRYRLKNVVAPNRRTGGTLCVVLAVAALFMGTRVFAFAEPVGTVKELIFSRYPEGAAVDGINISGDWNGIRGIRDIYGWREEELMDYIGSLRVRRLYCDEYSTDDNEEGKGLFVDMETVLLEEYGEVQNGLEVRNYLILSDGLLEANIPYDGNGNPLPYLLIDQIDWDYVESLLDFKAKAPDRDPAIPSWIQAEFSGEGLKEDLGLMIYGTLLNWDKNFAIELAQE